MSGVSVSSGHTTVSSRLISRDEGNLYLGGLGIERKGCSHLEMLRQNSNSSENVREKQPRSHVQETKSKLHF